MGAEIFLREGFARDGANAIVNDSNIYRCTLHMHWPELLNFTAF